MPSHSAPISTLTSCRSVVAIAAIAAIATVAACSGVHDDPEDAMDAGASRPAGSRGEDASLVLVTPRPVAAPPSSDAHVSPEDGGVPARPACVPEAGVDDPDDDFRDTNCDGIDGDGAAAIFVATTGSDTSPGTMEAPLHTLAKAVSAATTSGKAVYVCDGEYAESVVLDHVSVSLYGGYDCAHHWARHTERAVVKPPSGVPLVIDGATERVVIDRLALRAPDAVEASDSSVAASVFASADVRFTHDELAAGNGAAGSDGAAPPATVVTPTPATSPLSVPADTSCSMFQTGSGPLDGSDAACWLLPAGARGAYAVCPSGDLVFGGPGGTGGNVALGAAATAGRGGFPAGPGPNGVSGKAGLPGAAGGALGAIDHGRYVATSGGLPGAWGSPGGAGWGGAGGPTGGGGSPVMRYTIGGGGGSGGLPGCGGHGGLPGNGGGASIGLVSDGAHVALDWCLLMTGRGGNGGGGSSGGAGVPGGPGTPGGRGTQPDGAGLAGGLAGDGGSGGDGGPGGGGPSIGILFQGLPPVIAAPSFAVGDPGRGGASGARTAPPGISAEQYGVIAATDGGK